MAETAPLASSGPRSDVSIPPEAHLQLERTAHDVDYPIGPGERLRSASECCIKASLGVALGVAVTLAVVLSVLGAQQQARNSLRISFLVVGDWGRQGEHNQSLVADLMARKAETLQPEFIISTGDNFYPHGLNSTQDPLFDRSFVDVYSARSLQVPWHAVEGNHDHADGEKEEYCKGPDNPCHLGPVYQLGGALIDRDPRWHCERQYTVSLAGGLAELFFLDTSPFVDKYRKEEWAKYPGGLLEQSWEAQLREFEAQLASSSAPWKIVVGHHPPHSNGHHGNTWELIERVEPLLTQYGVQAWFAGHDHSLEHLHVPDAKYHIIVSGAGSKCDRGFNGQELSQYQWPYSGFVAATLTNNVLEVDFHHLECGEEAAYMAIIPRVPK